MIFIVTFDGLWMGGKAVIMANSEEEAIEKLHKHHLWQRKWEGTEEARETKSDGVLYIDDGNY